MHRSQQRSRAVAIPGILAIAVIAVSSAGTVRADTTQRAPEPGVCHGCAPPLVYHGGPVLDTNGLTITPIYWAPTGYSFPQSYTTIVNQYLTDVAAASGGSDNTYAIDNEYYQVASDGTKTTSNYKITAGTPITATDPFPSTANPCAVNPPYSACLNSEQIQSELASVIAANQLTADLNNLYVVLFPAGVQTYEGGSRSLDTYCGIHQSFQLPSNAGWVLYADEPYFTSGCSGGQAPNGDPIADAEVSVLSHEIIETITDPLNSSPSWYDTAGNEIGDECNFNFGPPTGSADPAHPDTTGYNQVINGHNYYVQTMFSNAAYAAKGVGNGCITTAYNSSTQSVFKTAATNAPATGTLDASETKLDADGKSTSKLTLTVLDASDEPVPGDHVHFDVQSNGEAEGACGTLSPADGTTDDNGEVTATYTASTDDAACIIFGIDAKSGASDWATIYQGTAADLQPAITDASMPDALTPGGDADTFTVTVANNSKNDIADARVDVFLSGDNNGAKGSTGVRADQVHLAYSDDTTGGKFVDVPLNGETVKDGEIEGYVMTDTAATLAAGATRTVTFRISLDSRAPSSHDSGAPLRIEADFDQFDPADGSPDNLDYVGPADVNVAPAGASGAFPVVLVAVIAAVVVVAAGAAALLLRRRGRKGTAPA